MFFIASLDVNSRLDRFLISSSVASLGDVRFYPTGPPLLSSVSFPTSVKSLRRGVERGSIKGMARQRRSWFLVVGEKKPAVW